MSPKQSSICWNPIEEQPPDKNVYFKRDYFKVEHMIKTN